MKNEKFWNLNCVFRPESNFWVIFSFRFETEKFQKMIPLEELNLEGNNVWNMSRSYSNGVLKTVVGLFFININKKLYITNTGLLKLFIYDCGHYNRGKSVTKKICKKPIQLKKSAKS